MCQIVNLPFQLVVTRDGSGADQTACNKTENIDNLVDIKNRYIEGWATKNS